MDLDTAPREALITHITLQGKQIRFQEKQIQGLRVELSEAHQQIDQLAYQLGELQGKVSTDSPIHIKPSVKKKGSRKKRQKRAKNFARKKDVPTQVINHAYQVCPDCGGKLYDGWLKSQRQVIDIPLTPVTITEHRVFEHWCGQCQKKVAPKVDLSDQVLGNHRVSLKLMSFMATLREELRLPVRAVQTYLKIFHKLNLSEGEIVAVLHRVAKLGQPAYQSLGDQIRASPVVHADETGWREDGLNGYIWNFNSPAVKYLLYRRSRGKQIVEEVIGDKFEGVLVSDFYAAYNTHLGYHQRCWVHLIRDIRKLTEVYPDDPKLNHWAKEVIKLYQQAKACQQQELDPKKHPHFLAQSQERSRQAVEFKNQLLNLCYPYLNTDTPIATLCKRIEKYQAELFVFVTDPAIPSDNNSAERSIRHSVIARKISGGTRSAKGSQTRFILASLFGTWKLQNQNPFQECLNLLTTASTTKPALQTVPGD